MASVKRDYYEVLEVDRGADGTTIKKAYRKMAVKYHPDKNQGDAEAEARFKEIGEAYEVLSDGEKRAAYDRFGHSAFSQGGGGFHAHDPFDVFREVFSGGGGGGGGIFGSIFEEAFGGGGGRSRGRGADLRYDMQITFEEAAKGCEKEITLKKLETCKTCDGTGAAKGGRAVTCPTCGGQGQVYAQRGFFSVAQACPDCGGSGEIIDRPCRDCNGEGRTEQTSKIKIKIPPGIEDGSRLRSSGQGEAGVRNGPRGDLYIVVHVKEHAIFQRDGTDLFCEVPISFASATLGGEVKVPTLDGSAKVKIPAGTPSGKVFRLRGKGVADLAGRGTGDLHVRVYVEVPTKLNTEQKKKLEEFAESCGEEHHPEISGFFDKVKQLFS
ncbi:MAG: molecular chaperone DnaJ [Verrucomicrobiota bacterium]